MIESDKEKKRRSVFSNIYLLSSRLQSVPLISRAGWNRTTGLSFHRRVPAACWGFSQAVHPLHEGLQLGLQGLEPAGQSADQRPVPEVGQLGNLGDGYKWMGKKMIDETARQLVVT